MGTTYSAQHKRVVRARGSASFRQCSTDCGGPARDWALIHDQDPEDPASYMPMCRGCHMRYDGAGDTGIGQRRAAQQQAKTHCPKRHEYTEANTYLVGPPGRKRRQCKTCTLGHPPR